MKRFLILFISISFVTVSCAGQKKWTKTDFGQYQFGKDREDCIQAVKDDPEQKLTVEECLAKKGYEPELSSDEENAKVVERAKTAGVVLLVTGLIVAYVVMSALVVLL